MKIKHLSLRMTIYFSIVMIFTLYITALLLAEFFTGELIEDKKVVYGQKYDLVLQSLDSSVDVVRNLHNSIVNNNEVINNLLAMADDYQSNKNMAEEMIKKELSVYMKKYSFIISTFVLNERDEILDPLYDNEVFNWIVYENPEFTLFKQKKMWGKFSTPNTFP